MPARTRMSVQARREQLLQIGVELLATNSYDDVWVEQVAVRAGVSRGLLYHYFPTKRDFVAAVVTVESERLLELINTEPRLSISEQLYAGLDAYLTYVEQHEQAYRMLYQGALTNDSEIQLIIKSALSVQEDRILDVFAAADPTASAPSHLVRIAVRAWLAFTIALCLEWLDDPTITRDQVRELGAQTLLNAVSTAAGQT